MEGIWEDNADKKDCTLQGNKWDPDEQNWRVFSAEFSNSWSLQNILLGYQVRSDETHGSVTLVTDKYFTRRSGRKLKKSMGQAGYVEGYYKNGS